MSLPVAAGFVRISLLLFMSSLPSSPFGAPFSMNFRTTVCSTKGAGNNTHATYNVSRYNETKLVLSCPGETGRSAYWMRADDSILCASRNCTINSDRKLTNDDSGDYLCKTSVENGTDYRFVHINVLENNFHATLKGWERTWDESRVFINHIPTPLLSLGLPDHYLAASRPDQPLAPPTLNRIVDCNEEGMCTLMQNTDIYPQTPYYINVSYYGNGPFSVDWYHNGSIFICNRSVNYCNRLQRGPTYQTLLLESGSLEDTMLMSGLYSAVVRNPYGTNESVIKLEYSCKAANRPHKSEITVDLQEDSLFNESCGVAMQSAQWMYACITKNHSATFADLSNDLDNCAICNGANDVGQECTNQFNSNITSITVSRLEDDGCPPVQMMNFMKNNVTVRDDDGIVIICAYSPASDSPIEPYKFIHLKVSHPPNNHSGRGQVSVTVSSTVVCLIIVLAVALTVASCVVLRKKKQQCCEDGVIQVSRDGPPERLDNNACLEEEHRPLINKDVTDCYGTISLAEEFPHELPEQGSQAAADVTIPSRSAPQ